MHELIPIGIVVALPEESRTLTRYARADGSPVRLGEKAWMAMSGSIGPEAAISASKNLLGAGANALVSWGSAGGLDPAFNAGDLLLPDRVVDSDGREYWPDPEWHKRLHDGLDQHFTVRAGTLLQSLSLVATVDEKRQLRECRHAEAVDMESAAIAHFARQRKIPFLVVRAITDTATMGIPRIVSDAIDNNGQVRLMRLLRHACMHPGALPTLFGLAHNFRAARRTLSELAGEAASGLFAAPNKPDFKPPSASTHCCDPRIP